MANSTAAARQLAGFSRPITPESDNRSNGALPSETIMPRPGEAGYLQAYLNSARRRNGTDNGETTIAQPSGDLFFGPDTKQFTPPTLEQQASQFGNAQALDSKTWANEQVGQRPTNPFAQALEKSGGTKTSPEQSPAANPLAEQTPKPAVLTQAELLTKMRQAREKIDAQQLKERRAELSQAVAAAQKATVPLTQVAGNLRSIALELGNNSQEAGVGKTGFVDQFRRFVNRVLTRQRNLAQLADQELKAKQAKRAKGGMEAGMPVKGPEVTAFIQKTIDSSGEQAGQNAGA